MTSTNMSSRRGGRTPPTPWSATRRGNSNPRVRLNMYRPKYSAEAVTPARSKQKIPPRPGRYMTNRAMQSNLNRDDGGRVGGRSSVRRALDELPVIRVEDYDMDDSYPKTVRQLNELKKLFSGSTPKVEASSQYYDPEPRAASSSTEGTEHHWTYIDTVADVDDYLNEEKIELTSESKTNVKEQKDMKDVSVQPDPEIAWLNHIRIAKVPRIKFIAEKFRRFKKNDVEVRQLIEKIVCVEYDVFDMGDPKECSKPKQILRAFFSVKPPGSGTGAREDAPLTQIPSYIKHKYHIADADLKKLNEKEIEIIDGKIAENRPYLDDLKKVLGRKHEHKKKKDVLDLQYLYEMAKRENHSSSDYDFSKYLSKDELNEVKDLILKRCVSSIHGIRRKVIKRKSVPEMTPDDATNCTGSTKNTLMDFINECDRHPSRIL